MQLILLNLFIDTNMAGGVQHQNTRRQISSNCACTLLYKTTHEESSATHSIQSQQSLETGLLVATCWVGINLVNIVYQEDKLHFDWPVYQEILTVPKRLR